jgi:hypothetical protein
MDLTDVQWAVLEPTFRPRRRPDGRGRPWTDPRAVMNGVLWFLRTGAPWHDLPPRGHPLGATRRELPGHGAARLCPDLAPGIYEIAFSPLIANR